MPSSPPRSPRCWFFPLLHAALLDFPAEGNKPSRRDTTPEGQERERLVTSEPWEGKQICNLWSMLAWNPTSPFVKLVSHVTHCPSLALANISGNSKGFAPNNVIMTIRMKKSFRRLLKSGVWEHQSTLSALAAISTAATCGFCLSAALCYWSFSIIKAKVTWILAIYTLLTTFDPAISVNTNIKNNDKHTSHSHLWAN